MHNFTADGALLLLCSPYRYVLTCNVPRHTQGDAIGRYPAPGVTSVPDCRRLSVFTRHVSHTRSVLILYYLYQRIYEQSFSVALELAVPHRS